MNLHTASVHIVPKTGTLCTKTALFVSIVPFCGTIRTVCQRSEYFKVYDGLLPLYVAGDYLLFVKETWLYFITVILSYDLT